MTTDIRLHLWYDHPTKGWKDGRTVSGYDLHELPYLLWDAARLWRRGRRPSVNVARPGR